MFIVICLLLFVMLVIRLQRMGRKKSPSYRLVISENARDTQGRALELLGHYNPVAQPKIVELKTDRIKHWLDQGAGTSEAVHNLLVREGVITADKKKKAVSISKKRQGKIDTKKSATEEAKKAAEATAMEAKAAEEDAAKQAEKEATEKEEAGSLPAVRQGEKEKTPVEEKKEEPAEEAAPAAEETPAEEEKKEEKTDDSKEEEKKSA